MATKIFKRANGKDVFDKLAEQDDSGGRETSTADIETSESTTELDTNESSESPDHDTGDADAAGENASVPPRRRRRLRRILATVAGVLVVGVLASSGFLAWQLKQQHDIDAAGRAALVTAQNYAVVLTSIDTTKVDENFTQVLDGATGEFKDMYSQSASQLRQVLIDNKAMSKGIVVDSAVKLATKSKVEVLLFVDQSITNSVNPEPRIDRSRVAITMELIDNRWLASNVELK
jgi:Mce-associated membrane protein